MRYPKAHADSSGSVPFALRGRKSLRAVLSAGVAGAIGLVPVVMAPTPALAAAVSGDLTVSSPSVLENAGTASVTVTWTGTASTQPTPETGLTWSTADDTAKAPYDYTSSSGTVTWSGTTATLSIPIANDTTDEADETFTVNVKNGSTTIGTGTVTIQDDDPAPTFTMTADKTTVTEASGANVKVTVKLSQATEKVVSIPITIANVTTTSADYSTSFVSPLVFNPGDPISKDITINITDDATDEDDQSFQVKVGTPTSNVTGTADPITITIVDNDDAPVVAFAGANTQVDENLDLNLPVTLTPASEKTVTVKYDTSDLAEGKQLTNNGLATAGKDYTAVAGGTVTFAPGETSKNATVKTLADDLDEVSPEDFQATLSSPTNATLGTRTTTIGQIADPSGTTSPTVTLSPKEVTEGSTGAWVPQTFTVKLSKASGKSQVIDWTTGSTGATATDAVAGTDFRSGTGSITFAPGELSKTFTVDVNSDKVDESDETFSITLANHTGSTLSSTTGDLGTTSIKILDDDSAPTFSVKDVTMDEGNDTSVALFTLNLSNPTSKTTSWKVTAVDGTAKSEAVPATHFGADDYSVPVATFTIPAGLSSGYTFALVNGDKIFEGDETASLKFEPNDATTIAAVSGAETSAKLTLKNDDTSPVLNIVSVTGKEGDTVTVNGLISGQSQDAVTFNTWFEGKAVGGAKAASADDFVNPGIQQKIVAAGTEIGTSVELAKIKLNVDTMPEPAETILVDGTALNNGGWVKTGSITIEANGTTPEEPGEAPKPTIKAPAKVTGPSTVEVEGTVAAGQKVELWGAPVGGGALKWLKNVTSDEDGYYWFEYNISSGYRFATMSQEMKSNEVAVWMTQDPIFVISTSTKGQLNLGVKGNPSWAGQTAAIQQWKNGGWVTIRSGKTGSDGVYRTGPKFTSGSSVVLRAWVAGEPGKGTLPAFTEQVRTTVK
ncbi:hypothetical protein JIG36_45710 [Actinoplanes sp. LDG1-06]|uniref:Calx-beta domain-containing protein n=1 Tax=Paractinoplanes ovalisporus TaxID=2810368 RepID=A0ABS2ASK0_9ACTN|nr:Calx-beta domain-containing protein [Actinoplanes ovalisporus]MBM2622822.1 hypothetical protein [Actinoplanes ovalisporus]